MSRASTATDPDRVIVVMTDQQRADLSAREGFGVDCTPTMDALARSGCWFDRAYTSAPVCVPARISMLTGRFPSAHRVRENAGVADARYSSDLFDVARRAGLRTALIGKNHTHLRPDRLDHWVEFGHLGQLRPEPDDPEQAAFDAWLRDHPQTSVEASPFGVSVQQPSRIVDHAIDWLNACGDTPSLLWVSFPEPHVPYQVPEPYFSAYSPDTVPPATTDRLPDWADVGWRHTRALSELSGEADPRVRDRARANYVGMLALIDDQLARLVTHLDATGNRSRTLIVVLADHGDFAGEYGLMRKGPGLPEALVRIPIIFTGAGVPAQKEPSAAHVSITDVLPTVCELLGWPTPDGVQGRSLVPLLRGDLVPPAEFATAYVEQGVGGLRHTDATAETTSAGAAVRDGRADRHAVVDTLNEITQCGSMRMLRAGDKKLVITESGRVHLFDLGSDPLELTDLAVEPSRDGELAELAVALVVQLIRAEDPLPVPAGSYPRRVHPRGFRTLDEDAVDQTSAEPVPA